MKPVTTLLATLLLALASSASSATTLGVNLLGNAGFESPIAFLPPPPENDWFFFPGDVGEPVTNFGGFSSENNPRTGERSLELYIADFSGTFTGVFQNVTGLSPGLTATFSGWLSGASVGGSRDSGVEIRIEWFDSESGDEIGRTPDLIPTPTETYEPFSVTGIVPEGADSANVVIARQSFTGPAGINVVFVDDADFTVVPLPGALLLMLGALGSLSLFRKRVA